MGNYLLTMLNNGTHPFNNHSVLNSTNMQTLIGRTVAMRNEHLGTGVSWYMDNFGNYTAWNHGGDYWNFASLCVVVPELSLGFWVSYGLGAARGRDLLLSAIQTTFFPSNNKTIPLQKSNSSLPAGQLYFLTRRPYSTPDKFAYVLLTFATSAVYITYDNANDKVSVLSNLDYSGFDSYSFVNNDPNFRFNHYPYLIYSNDSTPSSYLTVLEAVVGFDIPKLDSNLNFLIIFLVTINFIMIVTLIMHCILQCCCSCTPYIELPVNDYGKNPSIQGNTFKTIFTLLSILSIIIVIATLNLLVFGTLGTVFGEYGLMTTACLLPILLIIILVVQIILLIVGSVKARWHSSTHILFLIAIITNLCNIVFFLYGKCSVTKIFIDIRNSKTF